MKKRCRIGFILLAVLLLCACGTQPELPELPEEPPEVQETQSVSEEPPIKTEDTEPVFPAEAAEPVPAEEPPPPRVYQYFIRVNLFTNTLTVYSKDESGEYTVPYLSMICSTGEATPAEGVYYLPGNHWSWLSLQGQVYGQYATQITGNILFHSVPYETLYDKSSLETEEFNKLGTAASLGCVRLQAIDAKWIYDNAAAIEAVEFYSEPSPGPLGWPTVPYLYPFDERSGWDPTDPDPGNPWNVNVE